MTNSPASSIEELNAALQSQNPFDRPPNVNANQVWGKGFPDVEKLNAHASDAVFQALQQIRAGQYQTTSILITAESGTGKTHIISRIRHRLQDQGGALFVFANKWDDLNRIKHELQRTLATSLQKTGSKEVMQWQELATAMANQAIKVVQLNHKFSSPKELIELFDNLAQEETNKWMNQLTKGFIKTKDVSDPDIIRAIFWSLSDEQALYAVKWLAGEEIAQFKADELRLPNQCQSFDAVLQILDVISEFNELVICFDELDQYEYNDAGLVRAQVVAGLIKELFENLSRGVILSVMMPATWINKVKQLPTGVYSKVSAHRNPIDLKYMDGDSIIELVTLWLAEFYESRNLVSHDVYLFTESELRVLSDEKPPVRKVLQWCRDNWKIPATKADPVELAFNKELEEDYGCYSDDNLILSNAILLNIQILIESTINGLTINNVTDKVNITGRKDKHINFKIFCKQDEKDIIIGVAVLQYTGGQSLGNGLSKLIDYKTFGLTKGCLVRSKIKKISSHLEMKYLEPLIKEKGGEFVDLKEEDIKPLVAIHSVYQNRQVDYSLSEDQIFRFIAEKGAEKKLGYSNPVIKDILSSSYS